MKFFFCFKIILLFFSFSAFGNEECEKLFLQIAVYDPAVKTYYEVSVEKQKRLDECFGQLCRNNRKEIESAKVRTDSKVVLRGQRHEVRFPQDNLAYSQIDTYGPPFRRNGKWFISFYLREHVRKVDPETKNIVRENPDKNTNVLSDF